MFSMCWFTLWMIDHYCWPYKMEEQVCYYYCCHSTWSSLWDYKSEQKGTFLTGFMGLENKTEQPNTSTWQHVWTYRFRSPIDGYRWSVYMWYLGGGFIFFEYSPRRLGKWSNFNEHIFQRGWDLGHAGLLCFPTSHWSRLRVYYALRAARP